MKFILLIFAFFSVTAFADAFDAGQAQYFSLKAAYDAEQAAVKAPFDAEEARVRAVWDLKKAELAACTTFQCAKAVQAEITSCWNEVGTLSGNRYKAMVEVERRYEPIFADLALTTLLKGLKELATPALFQHVTDLGDTKCGFAFAPHVRCVQFNLEFKYDEHFYRVSRQFGLAMYCTPPAIAGDCHPSLQVVSRLFRNRTEFYRDMNPLLLTMKDYSLRFFRDERFYGTKPVLGADGLFGTRPISLVRVN